MLHHYYEGDYEFLSNPFASDFHSPVTHLSLTLHSLSEKNTTREALAFRKPRAWPRALPSATLLESTTPLIKSEWAVNIVYHAVVCVMIALNLLLLEYNQRKEEPRGRRRQGQVD